MGYGLAMAFAGAAKGYGEGLEKQADERRQNALAALKRQQNLDDEARGRAWELEDDARDRGYELEDEARGYARDDGKVGRAADVITSLFGTESGGDFNAANDEGYVGRAQFGQDRLDDWSAATGAPRVNREAFRKNPQLQKDVEKWHFDDIENFIDKNGLVEKYEGKKINGVTITRSGMIAMAHLGGQGGMKKFLETDGKYDPADSNKTSLSKYARIHGGLKTPRMDRETALVYADPDTPADVRERIDEKFGLGGKGSSKLTNHTWMQDENGDTIRMGYNENTGAYEPVPGAGGKPPTGTGGSRDKITATTSADIEQLFKDQMTDEIDRRSAAVFEEEVARLMSEEGLSDREAYSKAIQGMVFETISTTTGEGGRFLGIDWNGEKKTVEEQGKWERRFDYSTGRKDSTDEPEPTPAPEPEVEATPRTGLDGNPAQERERTRRAPPVSTPNVPAESSGIIGRDAKPSDYEELPAPKTKADYDKLEVGAEYITPTGKVLKKK